MIVPEIFLWVITAVLISILWKHTGLGGWVIPVVLAGSLSITSYHNFSFHPHYQVWLCNFTAFLTLALAVKFHQRLFDIVFYFAWTGDVFTFFVPDNQTLPALHQYPVVWVAYWLKHICPLIFTLYLIKIRGHRLSSNGILSAFASMGIYTILIAGYNYWFEQNILDLYEPTVEIENHFGEWPWYIVVNMTILSIWYYFIHFTGKQLKIIKIDDRINNFDP